jgi:hypothetical protein
MGYKLDDVMILPLPELDDSASSITAYNWPCSGMCALNMMLWLPMVTLWIRTYVMFSVGRDPCL